MVLDLVLMREERSDRIMRSDICLNIGLERPLQEVIKFKYGLSWRTQDVRDARVMEYLPRKAVSQIVKLVLEKELS